MSLKNDIFTRLESNSSVTALISDRIYFDIAPSTVFPLVIIETSQQTDTALNKSDLTKYIAVITCCGMTYDDANSLADLVFTTIDRQVFGNVVSILLSGREENASSLDGDADKIYYTQVLSFNSLSK